MKKLIQICSLLTLLVAFTVVTANAQNYGTEVEIPFSFNVGDRAYEAGRYIVKVSKVSPETSKLSIEDPESGKVQSVFMSITGESASSEMKLVFDTHEGQKFLSKVRTKETTYAIVVTGEDRDAAVRRAGDAGAASASNF